MPEAVIVASARSPIGRAGKGSLAGLRSSDPAAQMTRAVMDQVPTFDPERLDDIHLGCGQPAGFQGHGLARVLAVDLGLDGVPGVTVQRYCSSNLQD